MAKPPTLQTPSLPRLAQQLGRASSAASSTLAVPLTAAATGVALLGAPSVLRHALFDRFSEQDGRETASQVRELWAQLQKSSIYLVGFLDPLIGWLEDPQVRREDLTAFARCCGVLAKVDLTAVSESPAARGDILGPLYTFLRSTGTKKNLGAFFTPPDVAAVIAAVSGLREGVTVLEPACGAGGMVIAHVRAMRAAGLDPGTCEYVLNDLDALAVALAGVNLSAHGITRVQLRVGDALKF